MIRISTSLSLIALLSGCVAEQEVAGPSPEFAPVYPEVRQVSQVPTGSIYNRAHADSWFGEKTTYQIGDVVTVILDESMAGDSTQTNEMSRNTTTDVLTPAQLARFGGAGGLLLSDDENPIATQLSSSGSGEAEQSATLTGTMTAQVVEVYPNGNLLIRGEKIVNFSNGSEVIQVKGIIRPSDIQPDNTVQSKRIAGAQIAYKGVGQNANASRTPWGTNLFLSVWPF